MDCKLRLPEELVAQLAEQIVPVLTRQPEWDAATLEEFLQQALHQVGGAVLEALVGAMVNRYPPKAIPCPCGGHARYHFRRQGVLLTIYGRIGYRRAYYSCPRCHRGQYPLDQRLGLRPGRVSVKLGSLLALLGSQTAFQEAARLVERLLLLQVSENTIRHETQRYGRLQQQREGQWQQESQDMEQLIARRRTVTDPPRRLYGSLDGVIVPVDGQWMELKVGCWYEAREERGPKGREPPRLRAKALSYYCALSDAEGLRPLVWATGYQRQVDRAQEVVFIADGAAWIWKLVQYHFPHAVQIVDWYHAVAYLAPMAYAVWGETPQGQEWLERTREKLWQGRVQEVIAACQEYAQHPRAQEAVHRATTYYRNNAARMDYGRLRAAGYFIGSGSVESACKRIGTQRLKRAGARWSGQGALLTAKARAAWLSDDWEVLTARDRQLARAA